MTSGLGLSPASQALHFFFFFFFAGVFPVMGRLKLVSLFEIINIWLIVV